MSPTEHIVGLPVRVLKVPKNDAPSPETSEQIRSECEHLMVATELMHEFVYAGGKFRRYALVAVCRYCERLRNVKIPDLYYDRVAQCLDRYQMVGQLAKKQPEEIREMWARYYGRFWTGRERREVTARPEPSNSSDAAEEQPAVAHSQDFRSVNWLGESYSFTGTQAACIRILWEAWQKGAPDVSDAYILETADVQQDRLSQVFRMSGKPHPAWGNMIVRGQTKGTHRLAEPS